MPDTERSILRAGERFGSFEVIRRLGKGGMGEVYLVGKRFSLDRFAVKVLDPGIAERHPVTVDRFIREAEFAMKVRHPNLVEVYDAGRDPDTGLCYITMEYLPGGSLKDLIAADGVMAIPGVLTIANDIARALAFIDSKGMVHRDVKPDNILFSADGSAKLADLGITRFSGAEEEDSAESAASDCVIGTPAYMAPEQMLDAHAVDARADVYSLGVVMYEMLAGRRPDEGDNAMRKLAKALEGMSFADVRLLRPDTPDYLAALIARMTSPSPDRRPANARVVIGYLCHPERTAELVSDLTSPVEEEPERGPWYRDRGVLYALTAMLLALEAFAVTLVSVFRRY